MMCHWTYERTLRESTEISDMHPTDQLEKLFRDANVSDEAVSALKDFRCDACDRLKQPPSKRRVAVKHAETFNDTVSRGCEFLEGHFQGISLV